MNFFRWEAGKEAIFLLFMETTNVTDRSRLRVISTSSTGFCLSLETAEVSIIGALVGRPLSGGY
jgi:hypothetical protein